MRGEKGREHNRTIKTNPFGPTNSPTSKQEPIGYIQPRGRQSDITWRGESDRKESLFDPR